MTATVPTRQHPIQIAGRTIGVIVFLAVAFAGARNLLVEPRTSPLDVVLWAGTLVVGLMLFVAAVAALLSRPLLGGRDGSDHRYATAIMLAVVGFAAWGVIVAAAHGQWWPASACGAIVLAVTFDLWRAGRRRAASPPA